MHNKILKTLMITSALAFSSVSDAVVAQKGTIKALAPVPMAFQSGLTTHGQVTPPLTRFSPDDHRAQNLDDDNTNLSDTLSSSDTTF